MILVGYLVWTLKNRSGTETAHSIMDDGDAVFNDAIGKAIIELLANKSRSVRGVKSMPSLQSDRF